LIDLSPEAFLERLFSRFERFGLFDEIKVGEDADDFWETVRLKDVKEFEGFLWVDVLADGLL
jgi:hypothetical protein